MWLHVSSRCPAKEMSSAQVASEYVRTGKLCFFQTTAKKNKIQPEPSALNPEPKRASEAEVCGTIPGGHCLGLLQAWVRIWELRAAVRVQGLRLGFVNDLSRDAAVFCNPKVQSSVHVRCRCRTQASLRLVAYLSCIS